jgi:hypothetical protein
MLFDHNTTNTHAYFSGSIDRDIKNVTPASFYKFSILPRTTGCDNCMKTLFRIFVLGHVSNLPFSYI